MLCLAFLFILPYLPVLFMQKIQVMFPILQTLSRPVKGAKGINLYLIINLNLRDERFEVMDSMRTLADKFLEKYAMGVVNGINLYWNTQYTHHIGHFTLVDIEVPKQDNT
jgi:hypothetical protein